MFCENCGKQIPDEARFCPECGSPVASAEPVQPDVNPPAEAVRQDHVQEEIPVQSPYANSPYANSPYEAVRPNPEVQKPVQTPVQKPHKKGMPVWAIVLTVVGSVVLGFFLLAVLVGLLAGGSFTAQVPEEKESISVFSAEMPEAEKPEKKEEKPFDSSKKHLTVKHKETTTPFSYGPGMYKVGTDLPAGQYQVIKNTDERLCYYEVSSDSTGTFDSILVNGNVATFGFVTVEQGQYLTVERGGLMEAENAIIPQPDQQGNYCPGVYRVGIDIEAGEYMVTPDEGEMAYIEVSRDGTGSFGSIISNDIFEIPSYVTVSQGQYFTVERAVFQKA